MRLEHLLKKLTADPATRQLYHEQFQEYIRKGYVALFLQTQKKTVP